MSDNDQSSTGTANNCNLGDRYILVLFICELVHDARSTTYQGPTFSRERNAYQVKTHNLWYFALAPDTWEIMGLNTGAEFATWLCLNALSRLVLMARQCNYGNKTAGAMGKVGSAYMQFL